MSLATDRKLRGLFGSNPFGKPYEGSPLETLVNAINAPSFLVGDIQASVAAPYITPQTYYIVLGELALAAVVAKCVVKNKFASGDPTTIAAGTYVAFGTIDKSTGVFTAIATSKDVSGSLYTAVDVDAAGTEYPAGTCFAAEVVCPVGFTTALGLEIQVTK